MSQPKSSDRLPSVWEDLLEVVYAPRTVFRRRVGYEAFGLAMVILTVVSAAIFFATRSTLEPVFDATLKQQIAEAMRQNPQLKEEQLQGAQGMMRAGIAGTIMAAPIFIPLLSGLLLWVVGKFFESKAGIGAMLMTATYAYVPRLLGFVAGGVMAAFLPEERLTSFFAISLSPVQLVDQSTTSLGIMSALARCDVFILWQTIIEAVGVSVLGKIPMGRAAAIAVAVWALGMVPLIPAIMRG